MLEDKTDTGMTDVQDAAELEAGMTNVQDAAELTTGETAANSAAGKATEVEVDAATLQKQVDAFKAQGLDERNKRQAVEQQLYQYQQMLTQQQAMRQAAQPQQAVDPLQQLGVAPEDLYTEDGMRKLVGGMQEQVAKQVQEATARVRQDFNQQQFNQQAPDFTELVGRPGPTGYQYSPIFQHLMQRDPQVERELMQITDPIAQSRAAYRMAVQEKLIMDLESKQTSGQDIQAHIQAQTSPQSAAAVGGGGAFSKAQEVGSMSDDEFDRLDREAAGTA